MGLDVYCRWPDITEDEKQAQYTGFETDGKAGYLRQSWGSLGAWNGVFKTLFGMTWEDTLYPKWNGYNDGEGPDLTSSDVRQRLQDNRDKLLGFISNPIPIPESLNGYFSKLEEAGQIVTEEVQNVIDFINLALSKEGATIHFS